MQYEGYLRSEIAELKQIDERRTRLDITKQERKNMKKRAERVMLKFGKMTFKLYCARLASRPDKKTKNMIDKNYAGRVRLEQQQQLARWQSEIEGKLHWKLKRCNVVGNSETEGS